MPDLVIDEWLWADLNAENTPEDQQQAFSFLRAIYQKCDRIVWVENGAFISKFWPLCRNSNCLIRRNIVKYFQDCFLYNSNKSVRIENLSSQSLPEKLACEINPDDHYLLQTLLISRAQIIVTTDVKLNATLNQNGIPCALRDDFIEGYFAPRE